MRRMIGSGSALALVMALAISGCGGSGGAGGGTGQAPTPTPAPTPAPTPEPTPTPAPTPSGKTIFRLDGALSMRGGAFFTAAKEFDFGDQYNSRIYSNAYGVIQPNDQEDTPYSFFYKFTWSPDYSILTNAIDSTSGFNLALYAPIGASVVSPMTDILYKLDDPNRIMDGLQLSAGDFRLSSPVDFKSFSASQHFESPDPAIRQVAREMVANNIRLIALSTALSIASGGPLDAPPSDELAPMFQFAFSNNDRIARFLEDDRTARLYTKSGNRALLEWLNRNDLKKFQPATLDAMAHVINLYSAAIGTKVDSETDAARRMLGIPGWLTVQLTQLRFANNVETANRALALTEADVRAAINALDPLLPNMNARLFPAPDFFRMRANSEITLNNSYKGSTSGGADTTLVANDAQAQRAGLGSVNPDLTTASVTVPESQRHAISVALLADQSVHIRAINGFKGIAWFNYNVRAPDNEERTGRAYLIIE